MLQSKYDFKDIPSRHIRLAATKWNSVAALVVRSAHQPGASSGFRAAALLELASAPNPMKVATHAVDPSFF